MESADVSLEHIYGAVPVLNIGRMDHDEDQKAAGVGEDMALSAFDFLTCVIAANSATFRRFDRLAIDYTGAGRSFAALCFAQAHVQYHIHRIEKTGIAPGVEVASHR